MKKQAGPIITAILLFVCLCGVLYYIAFAPDPTTGSSLAAAQNTDVPIVAILMPDKNIERWATDGASMEQQLLAKGYDVRLVYADGSSDQQNKDIENMVSEGAKLLLIASVDAFSLSEQVEAAAKKGVHIIAYDRLIMNTDAVEYYVSFDGYEVGRLLGQALVDALQLDEPGASANIELFSGDPADFNATYYYNGKLSVLQPYLDSGVLQVPSGQISFDQTATLNWSMDRAYERMQNLLSSYYSGSTRLDAASVDADSLFPGVKQALDSDYRGSNKVFITGQDGNEDVLRTIVDDDTTMTVYKHVVDLAAVAADVADQILVGNPCDQALAESFPFDCTYDTENYDNGVKSVPSFLLTPILIKHENYSQILVDSGWFTVGDDGYLIPVK